MSIHGRKIILRNNIALEWKNDPLNGKANFAVFVPLRRTKLLFIYPRRAKGDESERSPFLDRKTFSRDLILLSWLPSRRQNIPPALLALVLASFEWRFLTKAQQFR